MLKYSLYMICFFRVVPVERLLKCLDFHDAYGPCPLKNPMHFVQKMSIR